MTFLKKLFGFLAGVLAILLALVILLTSYQNLNISEIVGSILLICMGIYVLLASFLGSKNYFVAVYASTLGAIIGVGILVLWIALKFESGKLDITFTVLDLIILGMAVIAFVWSHKNFKKVGRSSQSLQLEEGSADKDAKK